MVGARGAVWAPGDPLRVLVTGLAVSLRVRAGRPGPGDVAWDEVSRGQVGTVSK